MGLKLVSDGVGVARGVCCASFAHDAYSIPSYSHNIWRRGLLHQSCFIDEGSEAQRGDMTCIRLELRKLDYQLSWVYVIQHVYAMCSHAMDTPCVC